MKIDDELLNVLGKAYRSACGRNDVLISLGRIVTFEKFLREYFAQRRMRGLQA